MLYLASASPRRAEILAMLGYRFTVEPAQADETVFAYLQPAEMVSQLSTLKAQKIAEKHPQDLVLGSDTVVVLDGKVLGKPRDREDALSMLLLLSEKTHTVYTGVSLFQETCRHSFVDSAQVTFYPITRQQAMRYIETGEPMDKAGAYAVQGKGSVFVKELQGDFFTVMGLPAAKTARALARLGYAVF